MKPANKISSDLPQAFLSKMAVLLGDEMEAFVASLHQPTRVGLRVNTLKISARHFKGIAPFELSPVPWCPGGFMINDPGEEPGLVSPGKHPYHSAGLFYLQDPAAMAAAEVLSPQPGERILDLAAAPGGKATHLASLMENEGILVANEIHPARVWDLCENLERCGVTHAVVTNETPQHLADSLGEYFDRVMLDAPCSGEAMFRKSLQARKEWKPDLPSSCAFRQSAIIKQAARLVKPGGCLAYTTCSFSPEENEAVIYNFLAAHREFDLQATERHPGLQPARPEWVGLPEDHELNLAVRIWPHLSQGEGHFIAVLRKCGSTDLKGQAGRSESRFQSLNQRPSSIDTRLARKIWMDFAAENLSLLFSQEDIDIHGTRVYYQPRSVLGLAELNVIHPGWWLGSIRKGRFIPSHALAMGLRVAQAKRVVSLELGDEYVSAYLAGESYKHLGEDGWVLVTVDSYPLGWGKRVQGVIKNFYPRGLRRYS